MHLTQKIELEKYFFIGDCIMEGLFDVPVEESFQDDDPVSSVKEDKAKASFLNDEEDELLRYVRTVRKNIVEKLTNSNGQFVVPDKGTDKILLDQCLSGIADEQFKRAKGRKDTQVSENAAEWAEVLARTLMSRQGTNKRPAASAEDRRLPDDISAGEILPGETDEGCKPLTMADIRA